LTKTGLSVALVENELVGGHAFRVKHYFGPPEVVTEASEVEGAVHGMLSVESFLSRRDKFVDQWDDSKEKGVLEKAGVAIVHGQGHLDA